MNPPPTVEALRCRAHRLEYATIAWNLGEAAFTITLGLAAGSLALIGFGSDSLIEVFASALVVWHLWRHAPAADPQRTRRALYLVALAFLALAIVLATFAVRDLITGRAAGESPIGIAYLAVTAVVMFGLAAAKRRTALVLGSLPLRAEAAMTQLDGILSVLTLTGLALNAALGWAWADPLAALLVSGAALNAVRENWTEAAAMSRSA